MVSDRAPPVGAKPHPLEKADTGFQVATDTLHRMAVIARHHGNVHLSRLFQDCGGNIRFIHILGQGRQVEIQDESPLGNQGQVALDPCGDLRPGQPGLIVFIMDPYKIEVADNGWVQRFYQLVLLIKITAVEVVMPTQRRYRLKVVLPGEIKTDIIYVMQRSHNIIWLEGLNQAAGKRQRSGGQLGFEAHVNVQGACKAGLEFPGCLNIGRKAFIQAAGVQTGGPFIGIHEGVRDRRCMLCQADPGKSTPYIGLYYVCQGIDGMVAKFTAVTTVDGYIGWIGTRLDHVALYRFRVWATCLEVAGVFPNWRSCGPATPLSRPTAHSADGFLLRPVKKTPDCRILSAR